MKKVLIANRGEIAVRIVRACADYGVKSVAVYADADLDALHARMADEAYGLDGAAPGRHLPEHRQAAGRGRAQRRRRGAPRLRLPVGERRLCAGRDRRRPDLDRPAARRPSPRSATRCRRARSRCEVGAPLVAGTPGPGQGRGRGAGLCRAARPAHHHQGRVRRRRPRHEDRLAHGRGGRAVRRRPCARPSPPSAAASVLSSSFSTAPRHIEAQVLADTHGHVVVLGTRDCSLQRRNQKLVEEAPAPFLSDAQRARIHQSARDICAEAGYVSAGTVEFLLSPSRHDLVPRGQHPAAGRAHGDRGDHRHRPGGGAAAHRRRPAAVDHRHAGAARPCLRVPHQRRRRGPRLSAHTRPGHACSSRPRAPACASTPASSPARRCPAASTR